MPILNDPQNKTMYSGVPIIDGTALRHDCGCNDKRSSFVVFSDDHGRTWMAGEKMVLLLPAFGGGWTECDAAELTNGSVLLTSRNFYGASSGQSPRLFVRSDDGGATWAANWSAYDLPDPYCDAPILLDPMIHNGSIFFANPSKARSRVNFSIHRSDDQGRTRDHSYIIYPGGSAYSDLAYTRNGSIAVLFEKDNYNTVAFGVVPVSLVPNAGQRQHERQAAPVDGSPNRVALLADGQDLRLGMNAVP
jgi:sialidase-1